MTNLFKKYVNALPIENYLRNYLVEYEDGRTEILPGGCEKEIKHSSWKKSKMVKVAELAGLIQIPSNSERLYTPLRVTEFDEKYTLPIHPYVLGVLLGDGGLSQPSTLKLSTMDLEIKNRCEGFLPDGIFFVKCRGDNIDYRMKLKKPITRNPLRKYLETEGLCVTSEKKRIPVEYLKASLPDRIELIKGLMDTDGTIDAQGTSSFSSSSEKLALDMQSLIRSIGGIAKISSKIPHFTYKGTKREGLRSYRVNIRIQNPRILFTVPRKLLRAPEKNQYSDTLKLRLKKVVLQ